MLKVSYRPLAYAYLVCLLVAGAPAASGGLLGWTIDGCTDTVYGGAVTTNPALCNAQAAGFNGSALVVDPGIEFTVAGGVGSRDVDFTDDTVSLIYGPGQGSPSADLYVFTGLKGNIIGLQLLTGDPLLVTTAFTPTAIGLLVNSPQCCVDVTTTVTFKILTQVPEPATFALFGAGIAALAAIRRRC